MRVYLKKFLWFFLIFSAQNLFCYKKVTCIMHIHSVFSFGGKLTIEEIVQKARQKNIDAVVITDHDNTRVEYGLWPLRNLVKKTANFNSIFQIGIEKYLNEISRVQAKYPEIVLISGAESIPFYYWTGSPFKKNLVLHNWHKHLLIMGLKNPKDYRNLPLVGNKFYYKIDYFSFWPFVFLILGLFFIKKRLGIILVFIGIIFSGVNFPFTKTDFDQYHGDQKEPPYQALIDYVSSKNGLVFWAHPEARNWQNITKVGPISMQTLPYPESLLKTKNYHGFAYFWESSQIVGKPGGIWDRILNEYCDGLREKPIWAVAELDYTDDGVNGTYLDMSKNILLVNDLSYEEVIEVLKKGRFYAVAKYRKDNPEPVLEEFSIDGANFGEEISVDRIPVRVFLKVDTSDKQKYLASIDIIERGEVIKNIKKEIPSEIEFYLEPQTKYKKTYFRVEITVGNSSKLVTNPVFLNLTKRD